MNTREQVLAYIAERIIYNTSGQITDTVMRNVLNYANDRIYEPSEIPVSVEGIEGTNLQAALLELVGSGGLTIAEIVAGIEALTGVARLSYNALKDIPDPVPAPVSYADFIAIFDGTHYKSSEPVIVEEGDTVKFESRLSIAEEFSTIIWAKANQLTAEVEYARSRDVEFTFPDQGFYTISVSALKLGGSEIATKTVASYINAKDVSLWYVEFEATDYNGDPLAGVKVIFDGVTKYTNTSGIATFVNIATGSYVLSATKSGFTNINNAAFAVAANVDDSPLNMVLNPYIANAQLIGTPMPGETATALYDFVPALYEGATEIKWWVENSEGTVIVPSVTKTRGIDDGYLMFTIPEAAAGNILKAEIKAYDVQSNTNANMLKTPFMMVAVPSLPVYFGYRTTVQSAVINEGIVLGTTNPAQHSEINQSANHADFPNKIDIHWKDVFTAMDDFTEYTQWMAISEVTLASEYVYYQNINFLPSIGFYDTKGTIESLTVDGNAYKIYKIIPTAPVNLRLSVTGI